MPDKARCVYTCGASLSSSGRLVLSDLIKAGNRQMKVLEASYVKEEIVLLP